MRYLYGDSTPFPLTENFLATLSAATETCIALLKADEMYTVGREIIERAEECYAQESIRLEALARSFDESVAGFLPAGAAGSVTAAAATRLSALGRATLAAARAGSVRWRDGVIGAAMGNATEIILSSLGAFLRRHQLPRTRWSLMWRAGVGAGGPFAEVHGHAPCGLDATLAVELPAQHLWARPVKVALLERNLAVKMMKKGWVRGPRMRDERLDRYFITGLVSRPDRAALTLSRSAKEPSPGLELTFPLDGGVEVVATPIDALGAPVGPGVALQPSDAGAVTRLWRRVEELAADLIPYRRRLLVATLGGVPVLELEQPEVIAQAIVESIAPLVREIQRRSCTHGELALKREVADGQREEMFITCESLLRETRGLWLGHRAIFDAFGLEDQREGSTQVRLGNAIPRRPPLPALGLN